MLWDGWEAATPQTVEVAEMTARVEPEPKAWVRNGDDKMKERSERVVTERTAEERCSFVMYRNGDFRWW
jgi:hypothetical protein